MNNDDDVTVLLIADLLLFPRTSFEIADVASWP
jgi:hypothetical protein